MKLPFSLFAVAVGMALLLAAASARASVLYQQNFETIASGYLSGTDGFTSGYPTGGGNSTRANVTTSGGQTYSSGSLTVPGGNNEVTVQGNGNNNFAFINTFTPTSGGSTVYFSLSMSWSGLNSSSLVYFALSSSTSGGLNGSANLQYSGGLAINSFANGNGGTGNIGDIGGRMRNNSSAAGGDTDKDATGNPFPGVSTSGSTTSTQFIVGSLSSDGQHGSDYDVLNLWVDPTSTTLGTANDTITQDIGTSTLSYFYLFTGSVDGTNEYINVDNITIGTTAADVLGTAIPEPTSWALLLGGCAVLLSGSRRMRRVKL